MLFIVNGADDRIKGHAKCQQKRTNGNTYSQNLVFDSNSSFRETPEEGVLPPGRGKLLLVVLLALTGNEEQHEHSACHGDHANDGEYHGAVIAGLG